MDPQIIQQRIQDFKQNYTSLEYYVQNASELIKQLQEKIDKAQKASQKLHFYNFIISNGLKFQGNSSSKDYLQIACALRLTYGRRILLEKSIAELEDKKSVLKETADDKKDKFLNERKWSKEVEYDIEKSINENMKKEREESNNIKKNLEQFQNSLKESINELDKFAPNRNEIDLYYKLLNDLVQNLQKEYDKYNQNMDPTVNQIIATVDRSVAGLEERFNFYSEYLGKTLMNITNSKYVAQVLQSILQDVYQTYKNRFSEIKVKYSDVKQYQGQANLEEDLQRILKVKETNEKNYKILKERYNQKIVEENNLQNEINSLTSDIARIKNNNPQYFALYDRLKKLQDENNLQLEKENNEKEITELLQNAASQANNYLTEYRANPNNPNTIQKSKEDFKTLITKYEKDITNLIARAQQSFEEKIDDNSKELEQLINQCTRPPKPKEVKLEAESEDFSNPKLMDYKEENAQFNKTDDKVILEWGTLQTTLALIFYQENKEPHYMQLNIFAWHNTKEDNKDKVVDILEGFYNSLISSKTSFASIQIERITFENILVQYISAWVDMFPADFEQQEFRDKVIHNLLKKKDIGVDTGEIIQKLQTAYKILPPSLPKPSSKTITGKGKVNASISRKYDPQIIAEHMMYVDYDLFRQITYREYLQCGWSAKLNSHMLSPNLCDLTDRFNNISRYIQYTIVRESKSKEAAEVLASWINVMRECRKLNYYHGLFAIDGALSAPPILRLEKAWNIIPKELNNQYQTLSKICSPLKKFKNYKMALSDSTKNGIQETFPYVGPWLTDMTFIKDGNPKSKLEGGFELLNYVMHRAYYTAASYLKQNWCTKHSWHVNQNILAEVKELDLGTKETIDETKLLLLSKKVK